MKHPATFGHCYNTLQPTNMAPDFIYEGNQSSFFGWHIGAAICWSGQEALFSQLELLMNRSVIYKLHLG